MDKITVNIEVTDKMLNQLTDKILAKGGKKLLGKISKIALEKSKNKSEVTYTVKEVAEKTSQGKETILRHIKNEILIATKPGKSYIITQTNLNNYINGTYNE